MLLHGNYDHRFLAISAVLGMFAAYSTLELANRTRATGSRRLGLWLSCGSIVLGSGLCVANLAGMRGFLLTIPVLYHWPTLILSLTAAILTSAATLALLSREKTSARLCLLGGLAIAVGLAISHHLGIEAMRLPATMEYRWSLVVLSILSAAASSISCLMMMVSSEPEQQRQSRKMIAAVVLGAGVLLLHYSGMLAVTLHPSNASYSNSSTILISPIGIVALSVISFFVMILANVAACVDRVVAMQCDVAAAARGAEARFRVLAEAIPEIVWTAEPSGFVDYANRRLTELSGIKPERILGEEWANLIHPDDRALALEKWQAALRTGSTYEIEYRIHSVDGYRWYLVRGAPMLDDAGKIIKWYGSATDIEGQMRNQQVLEEQIKQHVEQLAEANERLQHEMWEKDLARRALDEQHEAMMQALKLRSQRATLLSKMGELLQSCQTREEVFTAALGFAPDIFPTRRGAVALFNASHNLVEVAGSWQECQLPAMSFEANACWALRTGHPHLVLTGDHTARCPHAAGVEQSYICIPILAQGEALGILHIQATDQDPKLGEAELSFKTTFASQVGLSVANIRLREALRAQSTKDPLTGVFNRRYLREMLDREIRRAVRAQQSLGILMLDLDHFKQFNDTYGHEAGDAVLRETASLLVRSVRAEDFVCRFGGEEFVVVLPTADLSATRARAERIRGKLRELTVMYDGQSVGMITVSVGVAGLPDHGTTEKDLIQAADTALYRAKHEGRDRVIVAGQPVAVDR